jgi:hypothetical protein
MDKRHKRKQKSREVIVAAIERLIDGSATHPRHIGIAVRITKEAVAREARRSPATLYRFPDLVDRISAIASTREQRVVRPSEQRRKALLDKIAELERRNELLLAENLHLIRALAKYDPNLGRKVPTSLNEARFRSTGRVQAR